LSADGRRFLVNVPVEETAAAPVMVWVGLAAGSR